MRFSKIQCLIAVLLAGTFLIPITRAEMEPAGWAGGEPSPTPTGPPQPSPTPRMIQLAFYFRRPARIIPVHRSEGETVIPLDGFEITDETPWVTNADLSGLAYEPEDDPKRLRLFLGPEGQEKFKEAMMGNVGRTVILTIDGTVRAAIRVLSLPRKDQIAVTGNFSAGELERLQDQIQSRPLPSPTPAPSPTPVERKKFIID
jgi:hypothetical protein